MPDASESKLPPALYLVATPVGNLEDITLRALRVLRSADVIACEDTRHTQKLLNHFDIHTRTTSYHEHNESERAQALVAEITAGRSIALVSDAGTPGINDPGYRIVQSAIAAGVTIVPVPGAVAAINALIASGLPTDSFYFGGFLPPRAGERRSALESLAPRQETLVLYEAPHRLLVALADIRDVLGADRRVCIARELTKVHEEFLRGAVTEVLQTLEQRGEVRGEITLVIAGATSAPTSQTATISERVRALMKSGEDEKSALKTAAKEFGMGKSEAYREWQRNKSRR
ncbi:MAG TPA: 16S rRNA (cytidine(1402)-2'-O)-methyltransferase [Terriglobales bacterium]|jgi:16S rRNA (cytidine1402-2'-O)-methyltransferase